MKQKLNDLILLLKRDRKAQVIAGLCVLAIGYLIVAPQPTQRRLNIPQGAPGGKDTTISTVKEHSADLAMRFAQDLETIKSQNAQNRQEIGQIRKDLDENVQRSAEIFRKILERVADSENRSAQSLGRTASARAADTSAGGVVPVSAEYGSDMGDADELQSFGDDSPTIVPPPPPEPSRVAVIGAGDSVRVKLLAGVNAPTDGSPYPVVFKLVSDIYGPDGSALPLGEARVVAAAQGSLSDQRALFRMTSLNIRFPDGRRKVVDIDGWIVGEDGIRGMKGVLYDPIGKAIVAEGMAGVLAGTALGFSQSQLDTSQDDNGNWNQVVSGNTTEYALGLGVANMAREYSKIIQDRVDMLVPYVEVLSGREASAVFARSITIPGLYDALESEDSPFSSLD